VYRDLDEVKNDKQEPNRTSGYERACLIAKSVFDLSYPRRRLKGKKYIEQSKGNNTPLYITLSNILFLLRVSVGDLVSKIISFDSFFMLISVEVVE